MSTNFQLFVYGTLQSGERAGSLLSACRKIGNGQVGGILYDIDGEFPALVLYGTSPVTGEIWQCPARMLHQLDSYEGIASGLFRRIAVTAESSDGPVACWAYVAGPRLAHQLTPGRRIARGKWSTASES